MTTTTRQQPETESALREALEAAERRFQAIISRAADAIVVVDDGGIVRFANPAAAEMFGRVREELVGNHFGFPMVAGETTEVDVVRGPQTVTIAEMRVVETEWAGEKVSLATLRDVTDRRQLEEERRRRLEERVARNEAEAAARRLELIASAGTLLASSLGDEPPLDELLCHLVETFAGWAAISLEGEAIHARHRDPRGQRRLDEQLDCLLPDGPRVLPSLQRAWETGTALIAPAAELRAGPLREAVGLEAALHVPLTAGEHPFGLLTLALDGGPAPPLLSHTVYLPEDLLLAEELGQRLALHLENNRLFRETERASQIRDEFLATVSHELRTPLQAILGWTAILREGAEDDPARRRAVEVIVRNAQAQKRLVDDLLDVSRIVTGRFRLETEVVRVGEVVETAVESIRPSAHAKKIEIAVELEPGAAELEMEGDRDRLQQVIWNLLSNSVKYTPEGGHVAVHARRDDPCVEIVVTDDGRGIEAELLPYVFHRFRRGGVAAGFDGASGLGLGLGIVRHLVELHGGEVSAHSDGEGRGTEMTVRLPLMDAAPPDLEETCA
jgi:signal transduction histidine kinase